MSGYPFIATPEWREMFPGAIAATIAIRNVTNPISNPALDDAKRALESELRLKWEGRTRADIKADPIVAIYGDYYKRFGQNYHVQMQIESIALEREIHTEPGGAGRGDVHGGTGDRCADGGSRSRAGGWQRDDRPHDRR